MHHQTQAFDASSISKIILLISRGAYQRPPDAYSSDMRDLLARMLQIKPEARPSVDDLLALPYVRWGRGGGVEARGMEGVSGLWGGGAGSACRAVLGGGRAACPRL